LKSDAPILLSGRITVTLTAAQLVDPLYVGSAAAIAFPATVAAPLATTLSPPVTVCPGTVGFDVATLIVDSEATAGA
jgi:hypothetical protein